MSYCTNLTNADVVPAALSGQTGRTQNGNFWTEHYRPEHTRYGAPYTGHLPYKLANILDERFKVGAIDQVIYSYSTPIAWRDSGKWIIPDVSYSITTSSKHQTHLWRLHGEGVPYDLSLEEYLRVVGGLMVFRVGRTFPASVVA